MTLLNITQNFIFRDCKTEWEMLNARVRVKSRELDHNCNQWFSIKCRSCLIYILFQINQIGFFSHISSCYPIVVVYLVLFAFLFSARSRTETPRTVSIESIIVLLVVALLFLLVNLTAFPDRSSHSISLSWRSDAENTGLSKSCYLITQMTHRFDSLFLSLNFSLSSFPTRIRKRSTKKHSPPVDLILWVYINSTLH